MEPCEELADLFICTLHIVHNEKLILSGSKINFLVETGGGEGVQILFHTGIGRKFPYIVLTENISENAQLHIVHNGELILSGSTINCLVQGACKCYFIQE